MSRDAELSKLQEAVRINNDNLFYNDNPEYRQIDIDRVENRKKELAETYNLERDSYIKEKWIHSLQWIVFQHLISIKT